MYFLATVHMFASHSSRLAISYENKQNELNELLVPAVMLPRDFLSQNSLFKVSVSSCLSMMPDVDE